MNNLDQMLQDTIKAAELIGAPYSESVIRQMLTDFPGFARGAVQFRSTTKASPRLDVRYEETNAPETPLEAARRAGYLADQGRAIDQLLPQIYENFEHLADGVDFDTESGLTKLWFFPKGAFPVEKTFDLSAMPAAVAEHRWFYDKYNLHSVYIIGIDYASQSMNLYLRFDQPEHHRFEVLRDMVEDLGFETPPADALLYSEPSVSAALTFRWDSPKVDRICFYVVHPNRAAAPKDLHPMVERFVDEVPAMKDSIYQVSWTFGSKGSYIKVENDYSGNLMEAIVSAILA